MTTLDLVLAPIYIVFLLAIALVIRNVRYKNKEDRRYFMTALMLKMAGAILVGLIYQYYYSYGDTYAYFYGGQSVTNTLLKEPDLAIKFWGGNTEYTLTQRLKDYHKSIDGLHLFRGASELFTIRVTSIFTTLGLGNYTATALLFAFMSFTGLWALYRTFIRFYPNMKKEMALAVFLLPSVFFWGSGILKDTIALGCLGWLTYATFKIFINGRLTIGLAAIIIVTVWMIANIKGYILILFLPALALWISNNYKGRIKSAFLRRIVGPFFLVMALGSGFLIISQLESVFGRYTFENIETAAASTQQWHSVANVEGSTYSLGSTDLSFSGMLRTFPAAVNVALFRPWPWEVSGPIMALMGLESLFFLGLTIIILLKLRGVGLKYAFSDPFINFCLLFSLLFAFAVGYTSYNFGALGRYKIPMMPYFLAGLFMMRSYLKKKEAERKAVAKREDEANRKNGPISELAN